MTLVIELPGDMRRVTTLLFEHRKVWTWETHDVNGCIAFDVNTGGESE
jgi:hypothetical protein